LLWGLHENGDHRRLARFLEGLTAATAKTTSATLQRRLNRWLSDAAERPVDTTFALEALAWATAAAEWTDAVVSPTCDALLERLMRDSAEVAQLGLASHPLVHQLLAGELALRLSLLHPQAKTARQLGADGRTAIATGLAELLDGRGVPHARYLPIVRPLLACWTRVAQLSDRLRGGWPASLAREYQRFVQTVLRLARPDGEAAFGWGKADEELLAAAVQHAGPDAKAIAALVFASDKMSARKRRAHTPSPTVYSEWSALAMCRAHWQHDAPRLTTAFAGRTNLVELAVGSDVLLSGVWQCDIAVNGIPIEPVGDWEEICWESDDDVDYLELEIDLTGGMRVQRHCVFAREDQFVLLADSVLSPSSVQLDYRGRLPLSDERRFRGASANTEGLLTGKSPLARVLPLELPEWRDASAGNLACAQRQIELTQSVIGRTLFAPLWIDLDRSRLRRPVTWRQLTVGESLEAVPRDVAVGYRVAVGKQQWLVYRSLGRKGNRTLLGHNLSTEMLVARFEQGEIAPLIEIE
jgi:hypothetical protein